MIAPSRVCWSVALVVALTSRSAAQDQKGTDDANEAVVKSVEVLKQGSNSQAVAEALEALGPDGPYTKTAIPYLINTLAEKDLHFSYRRKVLETLADYGPAAVPDLVLALKSSEVLVRLGAAQALADAKPRPIEAVPALIDVLKDQSPEVRKAAAWSLGVIRRPPERIVPALVAALGDDEVAVREAAVDSLGRIGPKAELAIPALISALKDNNDSVVFRAARALGEIGPVARSAVPAMVEVFKDKKFNSPQRGWIAIQIGEIGPGARKAVPILTEALQADDRALRSGAATALGEIGPDAKTAVPELIKLAKDNDKQSRNEAIKALGKIGPDARAAIPALIEALGKSKDGDTESNAAEALGRIGHEAQTAIPTLIVLARDREAVYSARKAAARAVINIDHELGAKEGMESAYLDLRLREVPSIKLEPRRALTEKRRKHIKSLIAQLAEIKDPDIGMSATLTGRAFAPLPDQKTIDTFRLAEHGTHTSDAFRGLVEMGPDALPLLLEALEDKTPTKLQIELNDRNRVTLGSHIESSNPLNPIERRVRSTQAEENLFLLMKAEQDAEDDRPRLRRYTLKVGDVCFVAIGQIVGRPYDAVSYQPSSRVAIYSPLERKALCDRVRAIWSGDDPAQKLLNSLLNDFATEGTFKSTVPGGWHEGSRYQVQAAMRLLYYFPKETAPLIASRLRSLDTTFHPSGDEGWQKREERNGVRTADFIKAVSWSNAERVQEALSEIAIRSNDPAIRDALPKQAGITQPKHAPVEEANCLAHAIVAGVFLLVLGTRLWGKHRSPVAAPPGK